MTTWITKSAGEKVAASHINDLQTLKVDKDLLAAFSADYETANNGVTDDAPKLRAAMIAAAAAGLELLLEDGSYLIASPLVAPSNLSMRGRGDNTILVLGANCDAISLDGVSNVRIRDLKIDGKSGAYTSTANSAIAGLAGGTGSSDIKIENITIVDMAGANILFLAQTGSHSDHIEILNCNISNAGGNAIICQDYVDNVVIRGNRVKGFAAIADNCPAIASGRSANNSQIIDNYIENTGTSGGNSSHGISIEGSNGVVCGNIVKGTRGLGIEVGEANHVAVVGNEVYSTISTGIAVTGSSGTASTQVAITGNVVCDPGGIGIYAYGVSDRDAEDIAAVGNTVHNSTDNLGILFNYVNKGAIVGNAVTDCHFAGIAITNSHLVDVNANSLANNNHSGDGGHKAYTTGSNEGVRINGFLARESSAHATSGAGEDTLASIVIPQYFYKSYAGLRVTAMGLKAGAGGNKTLKAYFGTNSFTFHAAANNTSDWRLDWTIHFYQDLGSFQETSWVGYDGSTVLQGHDETAGDLVAGAITLKLTGECADAGDTITQYGWLVEAF
jgi:hypothetical protein